MKRLSILLFLCCILAAASSAEPVIPFGTAVAWDSHSLLVNGRHVCPVMGEIHYSRVPADEWADEVRKMREGGVTIVATYVFWNHIEELENQFDWSGQRDLRRFLEVCKAEGMPVVLRMGPWCHGEVRNGGIPEWLFDKGCKVRSEGPQFLTYATRLYRQIFTQVQGLQWKDGGPVIAAQFDNEFRGPASYLLALKRIALSIGFDLPFYTRTGWPELTTPMPFGEMLPLYGDYADGFWDKSTREGAGSYYKAFNFKGQVQPASNMGAPDTDSPPALPIREGANTIENTNDSGQVTAPSLQGRAGGESVYPYFTCELGGGMATAYHRRPYLYPEDAYAMALVKLGSGSNLLGYYMYHGGTNPEGKLHALNECQTSPFTANNDLPTCTYDFQAPLGEFGQTYPQYYRLRPLHLFMHDFGELLAPMEAQFPTAQDLKQGDDSLLRWSYRTTSKPQNLNPSKPQPAFVFVNNYERFANLTAKSGVQFDVCGVQFPAKPITIPAGCSAIFPVNVEGILYATAQLVAKRNGKLYLMQIPGIPTNIALQSGKTLKNLKPRGTTKPVYGNLYLLNQQEAERLFLKIKDERLEMRDKGLEIKDDQAQPSLIFDLSSLISKIKEAGPLRTIAKGRAKVAEAPTEEEDWQQAACYRITFPEAAATKWHCLLSIAYHGDCARLYALTNNSGGTPSRRLIADNFYYGRPFLYGLWRLPEGCGELELRILPLQPDAPIYLPREASRTAGEAVEKVEIVTVDN